MKLGITGSRDILMFDFRKFFTLENEKFASFIRNLGFSGIDAIICGGAKGIDPLAEAAAKAIPLPIIRYDPDFGKYHGRLRFAAFLNRDEQIVHEANAMFAVWNGKMSSHGTLYTMNAAVEDGVPLFTVVVQEEKIVRSGIQTEIMEYAGRKRWKD